MHALAKPQVIGDIGSSAVTCLPSEVSWRRWGAEARGRKATLVMGTFDGVHLGHRALLDAALRDARTRSELVVAVTFIPAPEEVLAPDAGRRRLLSDCGRVAQLLATGADAVVAFDFTQTFASLAPEAFVDEALLAAQPTSAVHVGTNFRFGVFGAATPEVLSTLGTERGFTCVVHELEKVEGDVVSSTRIRRLLEAGSVAEAATLLGRAHFVRGAVVHGRGEGTGFGFPTANVEVDPHDCLPAQGVYACYVEVEGALWPAAVNVGAPVSFDVDKTSFLEASLIGFTGDIYGRQVAVHFVAWLRAARRFDTLEELTATVLDNIAWVREHLGEGPYEVDAHGEARI